MAGLKWSDADEIGCQLNERFPAVDPLKLRFTELREMVLELEAFDDEPAASSEPALEAIQMAWLEYRCQGN